MVVLPASLWLHDECGCAKAPIVGARYRYWSRNLVTGEDIGWCYFQVIDVDPMNHSRLLCRKAVCQFEHSGETFDTHVQEFFNGRYEAVDNVVPFG